MRSSDRQKFRARLDEAAGQELALQLTGERTVPGIWHENYWFQRHLAAYLAALSLTRGPTRPRGGLR